MVGLEGVNGGRRREVREGEGGSGYLGGGGLLVGCSGLVRRAARGDIP